MPAVSAPAGRAARSGLVARGVLRTAGAALIALLLQQVVRSADAPWIVRLLVMALVAASAWRPADALLVVAALLPFGAVLAPIPIRATEALALAWLCGALVPLPRPQEAAAEDTRLLLPAWCFLAVVLASLAVRLTLRDVGLAPWPLAVSVLRSVGAGYLVTAGRDLTLSSAMLPIEGVLLFAGVVLAGGRDPRLPRRLVAVLAVAGAAAAFLTFGQIAYTFARLGDPRVLTRFFAGERFSLVSADVNAAGSLLAMCGGMLSALAGWRTSTARGWMAALALVTLAIWLTGSRTAAVAFVAVGAAVATWRTGVRGDEVVRVPRPVLLGVAVLAIAAAAWGAWMVMHVDAPGSAGRALGFRSQFLVTSVRMFRAAPWFGVGVGQYYGLSGEFMPEALRATYRMENAHNYFMQVTTELGVIGIAAFVWLLGWPIVAAWRALLARPDDRIRLAAAAGVVAFVLTCVTGHPLLVPEIAMPFWMAMGAAVLAARGDGAPAATGRRPSLYPRVIAAVTIAAVVISFPWRAVAVMDTLTSAPAETGFRDPGVAPDGRGFRWMGDVAVVHVPSGPGLLEIPLRAPRVPGRGPFVAEVFVRGLLAERVTLPPDEWRTIAIAFRDTAPFHFRKITVRVSPTWQPGPEYGIRDPRPVTVMAGEVVFLPRSTNK